MLIKAGVLSMAGSLEIPINLGCCLKWSESRSVVSDSLRPHGLFSPWNSPGQNTGVGSLSLLQRIFPGDGTQVSHIAGRFFSSWAIREAQGNMGNQQRNTEVRLQKRSFYCLFSLLFLFFLFLMHTLYWSIFQYMWGFPDSSVGKESTCNAGDLN